MGRGYWILVWDSWGGGLVRVNPRLHADGEDLYGNPNNWWPCDDNTTEDDVIKKHGLDEKYNNCKVYFD